MLEGLRQMKNHNPRGILAAVVVVVFASCKTESISDLSTKEVTADITATATGSGSTNVNATFRKGAISLTFIQLTADDSVKVTSGSQNAQLKEFSLLGLVSYSASVPVDADGTQFTVALERKKDSGAPSSIATLPEAFTVTALSGSFSRAQSGPHLQWSNAGSDPMTLSIKGDCIQDFIASVTSGATDYTVAANALKKKTGSGTADGGTSVPDDCTVTANVDRSRPGTLDTGYAGGTIAGIQRRSVTFTSTP
jgi:hypothetical protein